MTGRKSDAIKSTMMVDKLLREYPQTARIFVDWQMACVGCPMSGFETVEEVAENYGKDPAQFVTDLETCADSLVATTDCS